MSGDAHQATRDLEAAVSSYTGAPFVVAVSSCTAAITIALAWNRLRNGGGQIRMPRLSYVGVPASIRNAGYTGVVFRDDDWRGEYCFEQEGVLGDWLSSPVWDSARRFTSGMHRRGALQCVSWHVSKILGDSQGGAILHDDAEADAWLRRARFDGRTEGVDPKSDQVQYPSWHAYMSPDVAARLLWKLQSLPKHNPDLQRSDYPDLSLMEAFK